MGIIGLDVIAIRHLSRQLDTQAREVETAAKELSSFIANTEWHGADRDAFERDWGSLHFPALRRSAGLLRDASAYAAQSATSQDEASRA
jgi:hypothetical protein